MGMCTCESNKNIINKFLDTELDPNNEVCMQIKLLKPITKLYNVHLTYFSFINIS